MKTHPSNFEGFRLGTRDIRACLTIMVALSALLYAGEVPVQGSDGDNSDDVKYLDYLLDMKVTSGSFLDLNLEKSPVSMTIITREEIGVSGARNMSELLEIFVPGFQYMFNRWNGTIWGMRGVANDRNTKIIYLINGHKMNTQARDGFQGETVLGLMGDVERVEVLRGPAGLVYGSGAIAGVVNVVTRKEKSDGSMACTRVGTYGSQEVDVDINATPGDDHTFSFTAGFRRADGLDARQSRIYGFGAWPFPATNQIKTGVPSDGHYGSTDGNWKAAGEWTYKNLDCYFRVTRQKESGGGWFILDPWPEIFGQPDSTKPAKYVDGIMVSPNDNFWRSTESYRATQRQYVVDNILANVNYSVPFGLNELQLDAAFDGNTTRTVYEQRNGYENDLFARDLNYIDNSFGEKRITANGIFHLNSVPRLQVASGMEYRFDAIGKDLEGRNENVGKLLHPIVSNIDYQTYSLFGEGLYEINKLFDAHLGGRLDFHTRAFMANAKAALIFHPKDLHAIKLICQSSSNNGSADNYEFNRYHFDDNGNVGSDISLVYSSNHPERSADVLQPAPPLATLHNLKPEKVYSTELAYTGIFFNNLTFAPSASVGYVNNIFGWSQKLFRVINAGNYNYFDLDVDLKYENKKFTIGSNHTFQRPIGTNVESEKRNYKIYTLPSSGPYYDSQIVNGSVKYFPIISDSMADFPVNLVKDGVTADGKDFLNLTTHSTKFYCTYKPFDWMTLHTNIRLFWGLPGRQAIYEKDTGFNYLHISDGTELGLYDYLKLGVSKKVNASIHFALPNNFEISLFAYDILGIDRPYDTDMRNYVINTLRWQQMYDPAQKELYSTDQRTFSFEIKKYF